MKCVFPSRLFPSHKGTATILCLATALYLSTGCGETTPRAANPAQPGSYQEGGGLSPFYAEEVLDHRLYVFGSKKTWEKFIATKEMDPMNSKRMIGVGPQVDGKRMTLILETTKDEPSKDKRILDTVEARYSLNLKG